MKLEKIQLSWFRGAADEITLESGSKNVVVYGSNASGKSSFVDGLEYIIKNGRISHLSHEYSGSRQEKGIRNTHTPEGFTSKVSIIFNDGSYIFTEIKPNGAFSINSEPREFHNYVQSWPIENHILRQDEVANFVHMTKGQKYSVLLPLLGLDNLEYAANNIQSLIRVINDQSRIDIVRNKIRYLVERINRFFVSDDYDAVLNGLKKLATKYGVDLTDDISKISYDILKVINNRIDEIKPENDRYVILNQVMGERLNEKIEEYIKYIEKIKGLINILIDQKISILESTKIYTEALPNLDEEISCPSCGQKILGKDLLQHVSDELEQLKEVRALRDATENALDTIKNSYRRVMRSLRSAELTPWLEDEKQEKIKMLVDKIGFISIDDIDSIPDEFNKFTNLMPNLIDLIQEEIKVAPPTVRDLLTDQTTILTGRTFPGIMILKNYEIKVMDVIRALQNSIKLIRDETRRKTEFILESISENVLTLWSKLHPNEPIEGIHLYIPEEADRAIDISLTFFGVDQPSPRLTLSESHRNCIGLCIFLALAIQRADPDSPIVLDDIVSSLDRGHRGMLVDIFLEDLKDRQILLFTHDREWYSELRTRLPASEWKFMVLRPWVDPTIGIRWSRSQFTFDDARELIGVIPEASGNRARAIMDGELAIVAEKIKLSLPYLRGDRNDHRTCVDFLTKIIGEAPRRLKRREGSEYIPYEEPLAIWRTARDLLIAWGDRASHNGTLIRTEAERLIETCEASLRCFRCSSCNDSVWIADLTSRERLQCSCGELQWRYE